MCVVHFKYCLNSQYTSFTASVGYVPCYSPLPLYVHCTYCVHVCTVHVHVLACIYTASAACACNMSLIGKHVFISQEQLVCFLACLGVFEFM